MVDEVDDLIFDRHCVTMSTHDNSVRNAQDYSTRCNVYSCDNLTKYKISMNRTDDELYAFNAHYGWQKVNHSMHAQYPPKKLKLARENPGKEIILNSTGCRDRVINQTRMEQETTLTKKRTPERLVVDEVDVSLCVPHNYRQDTSDMENSCV